MVDSSVSSNPGAQWSRPTASEGMPEGVENISGFRGPPEMLLDGFGDEFFCAADSLF